MFSPASRSCVTVRYGATAGLKQGLQSLEISPSGELTQGSCEIREMQVASGCRTEARRGWLGDALQTTSRAFAMSARSTVRKWCPDQCCRRRGAATRRRDAPACRPERSGSVTARKRLAVSRRRRRVIGGAYQAIAGHALSEQQVAGSRALSLRTPPL